METIYTNKKTLRKFNAEIMESRQLLASIDEACKGLTQADSGNFYDSCVAELGQITHNGVSVKTLAKDAGFTNGRQAVLEDADKAKLEAFVSKLPAMNVTQLQKAGLGLEAKLSAWFLNLLSFLPDQTMKSTVGIDAAAQKLLTPALELVKAQTDASKRLALLDGVFKMVNKGEGLIYKQAKTELQGAIKAVEVQGSEKVKSNGNNNQGGNNKASTSATPRPTNTVTHTAAPDQVVLGGQPASNVQYTAEQINHVKDLFGVI